VSGVAVVVVANWVMVVAATVEVVEPAPGEHPAMTTVVRARPRKIRREPSIQPA
jgi:hypothetical protein